MVKYEIVAATAEHAFELADSMRQADIDEVWATGHFTPTGALLAGLSASRDTKAGLADGEVMCMFSVIPLSALSFTGIPWMLGSKNLPKHSRAFLRRNKVYMNEMRSRFTLMFNYVDIRNTVAIRWLKWLGFEFDAPVLYGVEQRLFSRFWVESD